MGQGVGEAKGIAGASVEIDEPFERLDTTGHARSQIRFAGGQ